MKLPIIDIETTEKALLNDAEMLKQARMVMGLPLIERVFQLEAFKVAKDILETGVGDGLVQFKRGQASGMEIVLGKLREMADTAKPEGDKEKLEEKPVTET